MTPLPKQLRIYTIKFKKNVIKTM